MRENDVGKLNKQPGSLLHTSGCSKHQVICSSSCHHTIAMETLEEEQRRKHELALSRVMKLEQEIIREREATEAHVEEAKQVKVIIIISDMCVCHVKVYQ